MTGPPPLVSVILPTYNRLHYLQRAVASVFAQTQGNWELIVVDDGSTDGTTAYVLALADPRVRCITRPHCGNPAQVRNVGIAASRGAWLAFLDSDDIWEPEKLVLQLEALTDTRCRWSYGGYALIDERGERVRHSVGPPWRAFSGRILPELLTTRASVTICSVLAERALVEEVGMFDERIPYREDYDLELRLAAASAVAAVPQCVCRVREHSSRATTARDDHHWWAAYVYRKFRALTHDPEVRRLCDIQRASHLVAHGRRRLKAGSWKQALAALAAAASVYAFHPEHWGLGLRVLRASWARRRLRP